MGDPCLAVSSFSACSAAIWPISTVPATEVKADGVEVIWRSNSTTGMPAAVAASIEGFSALKSTAARMIAAGFKAMTSFIWLCWASVLLSALRVFTS